MPDPASPSSMTAEALEKEIQELERKQRVEELRRLRAGNNESRKGGSRGSERTRTMVSELVLPPPNLEECSSYNVYKDKLQLWELGVDISKKKKARLIILSLTDDSKFRRNLQDKFLEKYSADDLASDAALDFVKNYLEKELGRPELNKAVDEWR